MKTNKKQNLKQLLSQKKDLQLVKKTLDGNTDAFAELMSLYKKRVEAVGMGFFHNSQDTEDFIQEVFLKSYMKLETFRGESQFSTWLTRIAWTTAVNLKNRRKEYETISDDSILEYKGETPEEKEINRITASAVRESVKELPERYAVCLDFYFFHQLSYDEIAEITELPVNTIKSHIFRAKKILRDKLKDYRFNG